MAELSPAAQAVRDAALATYDNSIPKDDNLWALDRASVVAALRAAADQVGPKETLPFGHIYSAPAEEWHYQFKLQAKNKLLAIATELENHQ